MFGTFNFQAGNNGRLVGVLLGAVVVLFLLLFRLQGHSDRSGRAIRQLVESLTRGALRLGQRPNAECHRVPR